MVLVCHVVAIELKCTRLSKPPSPGDVSHGRHVAYTFSSHPPSIDTPPPPPLIFLFSCFFLPLFPLFFLFFSLSFPLVHPTLVSTLCLNSRRPFPLFNSIFLSITFTLSLHSLIPLFFSPSSKKKKKTTHSHSHSLLRPSHKKSKKIQQLQPLTISLLDKKPKKQQADVSTNHY